MSDELSLYHQKLERDEKYINAHSRKLRKFANDYGEVITEDEKVLLNDRNVVIKYDDIERSVELSETMQKEGEGTLICPCCGREIEEFESHDIYFINDEAIGCETSPQGSALTFEHYLKELG